MEDRTRELNCIECSLGLNSYRMILVFVEFHTEPNTMREREEQNQTKVRERIVLYRATALPHSFSRSRHHEHLVE